MQIRFTKMQGAGNDFVVLDETRALLNLSKAQYRFLADRHFGVGSDQILSVRSAPSPDVDFEYVIHNADGGEVEHCGNGARCFVRFVREQGLTDKTTVRVKTVNNTLTLTELPDARVKVDMGAPFFEHGDIPFDAAHASLRPQKNWHKWALARMEYGSNATDNIASGEVAVVSMGNPHAVQLVKDVNTAPVHTAGPWVESHPAFPRRVNAGFMQIVSRSQIKLRVYERGAGETLACGTGACAAVVCGIRLGLLDARVDVQTRGGVLTIEWDMAGELQNRLNEPLSAAGPSQGASAPRIGQSGAPAPARGSAPREAGSVGAHVFMTGPATTVFTGTVEVPDDLPAEPVLSRFI